MAQAPSSIDSLTFGIEIELFVRPKKELLKVLPNYGWDPRINSTDKNEVAKKKNRDALRKGLSGALQEAGLASSPDVKSAYEHWAVEQDPSLDDFSGYWGIEVISRVLSSDIFWKGEVDIVFNVLRETCDILLTMGSSMHIHVSPGVSDVSPYTLGQLKSLVKAICYFDDATTKIMPADRKANPYAESNVLGSCVPSNIRRAYQDVSTKSWKPLFKVIDGIPHKAFVHNRFGESRYLSWNFANICGECGTVEFRRPPGVKMSEDANHWVAFTLGFVTSALSYDWTRVAFLRDRPPVNQLAEFVINGSSMLKNPCLQWVLRDKMVENTSPVVPLTALQQNEIKKKKDKFKDMQSSFVQKANSRPSTPVSSAGSRSSSRLSS